MTQYALVCPNCRHLHESALLIGSSVNGIRSGAMIRCNRCTAWATWDGEILRPSTESELASVPAEAIGDAVDVAAMEQQFDA